MKINKWLYIVFFGVISSALTWYVMGFEFVKSSQDLVYSLSHIFYEFVIVAASLFIIFDSVSAIKHSGNSVRRFTRLGIGFAILTVHLTAVVFGGYP